MRAALADRNDRAGSASHQAEHLAQIRSGRSDPRFESSGDTPFLAREEPVRHHDTGFGVAERSEGARGCVDYRFDRHPSVTRPGQASSRQTEAVQLKNSQRMPVRTARRCTAR